MRTLTLLLLATYGTAATAIPLAANDFSTSQIAAQTDYVLGARDVIVITVFGEASLSGRYVVADDGSIRMPEIGRVVMAGLTKDGLAAHLETLLRDGYLRSPQVTVQMMEHRSQRVDVTGAVKQPGEYFLRGETTLLQLLSRAGGVEADTSIGEVRVRRANGEEFTVNYSELSSNATGNMVLNAGDVVLVPEGQQVFVGGEVKQPGALLFADGLTATQALTRVGGPTPLARLRGAYILRDGERLTLNLKRILDGRDTNLVLQPGDQLYLRKSVF
ncbi:MAG: polysaccharide export outer membrane protein [Myxococcota bacterium]|jgi:polysaccharide export outer membrane protein